LTISKSMDRFTDKKWYDDENDIRINSKLIAGVKVWKHHDFSVTLQAYGGRPHCIVNNYNPEIYDTTAVKWFTKRFNPTFFLSARYTFTLTAKKVTFGAYFDIQNILNQKHAVSMLDIGNGEMTKKYLSGILPTAGITVKF
jgi:hypothetical protein